MHRVSDLADPNRCKGAAPDGQCRNEAEPGSEYCRAHGGTDKELPERKMKYHLTRARHRHRLAQLVDHEDAKSLREEIAMTNMLIEEVWNKASESDAALLQSCGTLNQLLVTLEKLIKTSEQVEKNLGLTLSKTTIVMFGQEMVSLLKEELKDVPGFEQKIDRITSRMLDTIEHTTNLPENP